MRQCFLSGSMRQKIYDRIQQLKQETSLVAQTARRKFIVPRDVLIAKRMLKETNL